MHVNELAKESETNKEYPYEALGKKTAVEPISLGGNQYKGKLHFTAEFVPALALQGVKFESGPNELQAAVEHEPAGSEGGETIDTAPSSPSVASEEDIPMEVTTALPLGASEEEEEKVLKERRATGHIKGAKSTDTTDTVDTTHTADTTHTNGTAAEAEPKEEGVKLSRDELLKQREI